MKHPGSISREEANNHLRKHQSLMLGGAIDLANENNLYFDNLYHYSFFCSVFFVVYCKIYFLINKYIGMYVCWFVSVCECYQ